MSGTGVDEMDMASQGGYSRAQLQRYIKFARQFHPEITDAAKERLVECYRLLRQNDSTGR